MSKSSFCTVCHISNMGFTNNTSAGVGLAHWTSESSSELAKPNVLVTYKRNKLGEKLVVNVICLKSTKSYESCWCHNHPGLRASRAKLSVRSGWEGWHMLPKHSHESRWLAQELKESRNKYWMGNQNMVKKHHHPSLLGGLSKSLHVCIKLREIRCTDHMTRLLPGQPITITTVAFLCTLPNSTLSPDHWNLSKRAL